GTTILDNTGGDINQTDHILKTMFPQIEDMINVKKFIDDMRLQRTKASIKSLE
ncbi:MAG: hypothetical protein HY755_12885, partial [Nitrospirae bacterium]|nr:hypothetical protein [Nitrospirota bacterium]